MIAGAHEKSIRWGSLRTGIHLQGIDRKIASWATVDDYDSVLDLFADSGNMLNFLGAKYRIRACGLCSSNDQAQIIRSRTASAEIIYGTGDNIPWRDNTFDVTLYGSLFNRVAGADMILKDILRVMKPGGQFVSACSWMPQRNYKLSEWISGGHEPLIDARRLLTLMENTGFRESSWRPAGLSSGIVIGWKALV
jgi:SAM-dependent methyltransferase